MYCLGASIGSKITSDKEEEEEEEEEEEGFLVC